MKISQRVANLKPAATVAITNRAKDLVKQGVGLVSFTAGEPDFDTPERIKKAAIDGLNRNMTHYMPPLGDQDSRSAIADKVTRENNLQGVTWEHVAVSGGGKQALYVIFQCLFDTPAPGEAPLELVLPTPAWVSYASLAELAGAKVVEVPTTPEAEFKMTPAQLKAAITPRTRAVLLNSPSNPCSTMYSEGELRDLGAVIEEAARTIAPDIVIVSDEMYEKIIFGGIPHFSIGSIPAIAERTITVNGLSKSYAMTGWRIGYTVCPGAEGKKLISAMGVLQGQLITNITSFIYPSIRAALTLCADDVEHMRQSFAQRGELAYGLLRQIPGLLCPRPTGAFYLFPQVSAHYGKTTPGGRKITNSLDFAEGLLTEARVAVIPGCEFGTPGDNHIRLTFACAEDSIRKGIQRLGEFVASLR